MSSLYVRNLDPIIYEKIKMKATEKNISVNSLVKIILDKAMVSHEMVEYTQLIVDSLNRNTASYNELIVAIERQTLALNEVIKKQNELLE